MFSRLNICIHTLNICIYANVHPCAQTKLHIYIIYMQCKTPSHHAQAISAAGSCSQHSTILQQSSPQATVGFY